MADWTFLNEYRHVTGIEHLFSDINGSRLIFIDDKNDGYVYNPVNDNIVEIPSIPTNTKGILWETFTSDKVISANLI